MAARRQRFTQTLAFFVRKSDSSAAISSSRCSTLCAFVANRGSLANTSLPSTPVQSSWKWRSVPPPIANGRALAWESWYGTIAARALPSARPRHQLPREGRPSLRLQVQGQGFLAAVEGEKVRREAVHDRRPPPPRLIPPPRLLDLDPPRPVVREELRAERPRQDAGEIRDS